MARREATDRGGSEPVVLLVDDDAGIRQMVRQVLRQKGYQVKVVQDGDQALELLEAGEQVDLILTDVVMHGMDGVELSLLAHRIVPDTPILFMSGYPELLLNDERIGRGPTLLRKPFRAPELLDAVARALDGGFGDGEGGARRGG